MDEKSIMCFAGMLLKDFKEPPEDQPNSKLMECEHCSEKMWMSGKKRKLMKCFEKERCIVGCWPCCIEILNKEKNACVMPINI